MNISESKITQVFVADEYEATLATAGAATYVDNTSTKSLALIRYDGSEEQPITVIPKDKIVSAKFAAGVPLRTLQRYPLAFTSGVSVVTGTEYTLQIEVHNLFGFTRPAITSVSYVATSADTASTVLAAIAKLAKLQFEDKDSFLYNAATVDTANLRIDEKSIKTAAGIDWCTVTKSALSTTIPNGRKVANMEWAYQTQRQNTSYGVGDPRIDMNHDLLYADATKTYDIITITVKSEDRNGTPSEYDVVVASDHAATANFASLLFYYPISLVSYVTVISRTLTNTSLLKRSLTNR